MSISNKYYLFDVNVKAGWTGAWREICQREAKQRAECANKISPPPHLSLNILIFPSKFIPNKLKTRDIKSYWRRGRLGGRG